MKKSKECVDYIDQELENGNPILVGVRYAFKKDAEINHDNTTDHFVVIIGRKCNNGNIYYLFYDVAKSDKSLGTSNENRLYLEPDNTLKGVPAWNTARLYTLSQVRGNKGDGSDLN